MKKIGVLLFAFLFLLSFFVNIASSQTPDLPLEDELNEGLGDLRDTAEDVQSFSERERWEYLGDQWKEILLKNSFISKVDTGFRKINFLFFLLFGEDYDLSFTFFFSLILWVLFLVIISEVFILYGAFSENTNWILALVFAIVLGHLKVYNGISVVLFKIIFFRQGIWGWLTFSLFLIVYFFILFWFRKFMEEIIKKRKKHKEERDKKQAEFDREVIHKTADAVLKGTGAKK